MTARAIAMPRRAPSMRRLLAPIVALVAAIVIAGCGDGRLSKNDYITKSNKIQSDASAALSKVNTSSGKPSDMKKVVAEIDAAIAETEKLKPPTEWQKHHDKMLAAMKEMRDAMDGLSKAKAGDVKAAQAALKKVNDANTDYEAAISAINADR